MEQTPTILLTNDDGIESPGLGTLYERLSELADVTVVAPSVEHSGVGRVLSFGRPVPIQTGAETDEIEMDSSELAHEVPYETHDLGYAVEGTPCDCVIAGVTALGIEPDIVVSGCNPGPNIGLSAFGRSGTVSAALEAAYLGVPGIAVSSKSRNPTDDEYQRVSMFMKQLIKYTQAHEVFGRIDYLNISTPSGEYRDVKLTRPVENYGFTATKADSNVAFRFTHSKNGTESSESPSKSQAPTDREVLKQGMVSITPLLAPYTPTETTLLRNFTNTVL